MKCVATCFLILPFCLACSDSVVEKPNLDTLKVDSLEIIWKSRISPAGGGITFSISPQLSSGTVAFTSEYYMYGQNGPLMFFDTADGRLVDTWQDHSTSRRTYYDLNSGSEGQHLVLADWETVDCVNMSTKHTAWSAQLDENPPSVFVYDGYVYKGIHFNPVGSNGFFNNAAIMRAPINTGVFDTVYSFSRSDRYLPEFAGMGFGTLSTGGHVAAWMNKGIKNENGPQCRPEIFVYDLDSDSLMWRITDYEGEFPGHLPLCVFDDKVIVQFGVHLAAYDLLSGTKLWGLGRNELANREGALMVSEAVFPLNGEIIYLGIQPVIFSIDPALGTINWQKKVNRGTRNDLTYFEGKFFYTNRGLSIVDASTGEDLITEEQAANLPYVTGKVVIDPDRRVMYMHNGVHAFCVKIPNDL